MDQKIIKENVIGIYDENKLIAVGVRDNKSGKTVLYRIEELGFDGVFNLLEDISGSSKVK
jgi:hypothetical protein